MRLSISSHLSNSINGGWLCKGCCLAIQEKNLYLLLAEQQEGTNACLGQGYKVPEQCPVSLKVLFLSSTLVLHPFSKDFHPKNSTFFPCNIPLLAVS